jgi:hypothetical protein
VVLSQLEEHAAYGGVVPEIAARAHVEALDRLIEEGAARAGTRWTRSTHRRDRRARPDRRADRRPPDRQGDGNGDRQAALSPSTISKAMR